MKKIIVITQINVKNQMSLDYQYVTYIVYV